MRNCQAKQAGWPTAERKEGGVLMTTAILTRAGVWQGTRTHKAVYVLSLFGGVGLWSAMTLCPALWYDESFTLAVVTQSWAGLWRTATADFHPPLYYGMLKAFCSLWGYRLPVMRVFSLLPALCLGVFGWTHIRRAFGERAGALFSLLVLFFPAAPFFVNEIRMYAWALLFTTLAAFYAWQWRTHELPRYAVLFVLFAILGAYTHYYALLTVIAINLLFLYHGVRRQKGWKAVLLPAAVQVLGYLPGFFLLARKVKNVAGGYWIPNSPLLYLSALAFIAVSILLAFLVRRDTRFAAASRAAAGAITLTLGMALAFSVCIRPVFVPRYLIPLLGILLFQLTGALLIQNWKHLSRSLLTIFILCLVCQVGNLVRSYAPQNDALAELSAQLGPQDAIVLEDCQIAGPVAAKGNASPVYWIKNKDPLNFLAFRKHATFAASVRDVPLRPGGRVLVVDTQGTDLRADMLTRGFREIVPPHQMRPPYTFWVSLRVSIFEKAAPAN